MICLYLTKAYDALDRSRSLEILNGVRSGRKSETAAEGVLEQDDDGSKGVGILRDRLQGRAGRDTGRPAVTHHYQYGGEFGGPPLGQSGGDGSRNERRAGSGGKAPGRPLLRGRRNDSVVQPPMATVGVYAASWTV